MSDSDSVLSSEQNSGLELILKTGRGPTWTRAAMNFLAIAATSAIGGSAALLAGISSAAFGAATYIHGEESQAGTNKLHAACIQEIDATVQELQVAVAQVVLSISTTEDQFAAKVDDPHYQMLIRKAFTGWSRGQTKEKREMIRRLLSHAADIPNPDFPLFELFFDWVARYNELHFLLIKSLKMSRSGTRWEIWSGMGGKVVKDNSAEAGVFNCLMMDLTFGHVLHIKREYDHTGRALKRAPRRSSSPSPYMKSPIDDEDEHELTAVGLKFVHHTMEEIITKLGAPPL